MDNWKCLFCGSTERLVKQLFPDGSEKMELGPSGDYEPVYEMCCKAQKVNFSYARQHIDVNTGKPMDIDEVNEP